MSSTPCQRTSELLAIPVGSEIMLAVLDRPAGESLGASLLVVPPAKVRGATEWHGVDRMLVDAIGARGLATLRFDWVGTGDSTGVGADFSRDLPRSAEVAAAALALRQAGATQIIGAGNCYAATALLGAAAEGAEIDAIALGTLQVLTEDYEDAAAFKAAQRLTMLDYVRRALSARTIRRLTDEHQRRRFANLVRAKLNLARVPSASGRDGQQRWMSSTIVSQLRSVGERRLPTLLLFGQEDPELARFRRLQAGPLASALPAETTEVVVTPGVLHFRTTPARQQNYIDAVVEWVVAQLGES